MNEYTRREEVRWTLIASLALVLCMAPAVFLLVTAQGKLIPDAAAQSAAKVAEERVTLTHACVTAAEKLASEIDVFKSSAKAARLDVADEADAGAPKRKPPVRGKPPKEKEPDVALAWPNAHTSIKQAKQLAPCRLTVEATLGTKAELSPIWDVIAKAAEVTANDKNEQLAGVRTLLKLLGDAPVDKLLKAAQETEAEHKKQADQAKTTAATAMVREPIPEGIIPRRIAVGIGVGLSVITLLLSYLSVRVASVRRLTTLVPLREAAKTAQPGLHAAAVLRLAAQHNGGTPGMVIGAALGGLLAAAIVPADTDVFIVGVMSGCILGLGIQWAIRMAQGASQWRTRANELADVEKPAIPIVLVLSGVNAGLEAPFITFFNGLSPGDAALTVEKLAAQAEEKILAAADAGATGRSNIPS